MRVAIQGIKGSFHHIVAEEYFGKNIDLVECMSFSEMPGLLLSKKAEVIVMAIENSIAGAILPNYALIDDHKLTICGEHYLPIHHNLMALGGQTIADIKEVYSHPMALLQCHKFFNDYPHIKLIEDKDTAAVAKR
ncbi:MAG: prephenate dehydratase domain-containing protein, partial [Lutibacter sp.]